jgi:hypothetical protein
MRFLISGIDFPFDNPRSLRDALIFASHHFGERLDGHLDSRCTLFITHDAQAKLPVIPSEAFGTWLFESGIPMIARSDSMGSYEYFFHLIEELTPYAAAWSRLELVCLHLSVAEPASINKGSHHFSSI